MIAKESIHPGESRMDEGRCVCTAVLCMCSVLVLKLPAMGVLECNVTNSWRSYLE